jgi:signal transduction histidine kinase
VKRRLVAAIAGVAALSVTLFAVPLGVVLQRHYRDEELLRLQRDTVAATRQIDLGETTRDQIELPRGPAQLTVYDRAGRRVAGTAGPPMADGVVRETLRGGRPADRAADGRLIAAVPLVVGERVTGAVRADRDDDRAVARAHASWWRLAGIGAGVVALAVAAAFVLAARLARPLQRLAGSATRLGQGNFAARAPRAGVPEVDVVAAALDATAARLHDMLSRERAFSSDASHQLRTPLAALRLELEAVELRGEPPTEIRAALAQVDRLEDTIATLLAVARDAPRASTEVPLGRLLDETERRWRSPLAAAGRPFRVGRGEPGAAVRASEAVLREILDVLVDNALRHGGGAVDVRVRDAGEWLAIDVRDEGAGVSAERDPFERRTGDGVGIGLALARALAHAEGGRLELTHAGPGPVFSLVVPSAAA